MSDSFRNAIRIVSAVVFTTCVVCASAGTCPAVELSAGDIVITADLGATAGGDDFGVMLVDPATGNRTIISDATHGGGPLFDFNPSSPFGAPPAGISRLAGGQLLVSAINGIFSVDPATGNRTMISSQRAFDAIEVYGQIYAVNGTTLFRVDPTTGNTTPLTGLGSEAVALTFADGQLFTGVEGFIDSFSLSGSFIASYTPFAAALSLAATPDGNVLLGTASTVLTGPAVVSFNPNIPDPFDAHSISSGSGAPLISVTGLGVGTNGVVWAANFPMSGIAGSILGIDPTTGNRSILSNSTHGIGPMFIAPYGLAVVPEPGTFALATFGAAILLGLRYRK